MEEGHVKKVTLPGIKKSARKSVRKSGRKATTNLKNKAKDVVKESVDKVKPSGKKPAANRLKALAKRKKVAIEKSEKEDKHIGMIEAAQEGIPAANEMESKSILVSFKSLFRDCKSCQLIMTLCHENVS